MKTIAGICIVVAALVSAGCGNSPESPTAPTTTSTTTVRTGHFVGSLTAGETRFFSFTVAEAGTVTAMLASITSPRTGATVDATLGFGIGRPAGTQCALSTSINTPASLTAQLQQQAEAGIYCINVSDPGQLNGDVNFAVRFSYP
jgi:hypothetical protein